MELRQLRYALSIARMRNLGSAAEQLGVTQSALSRSMMALEQEFGVKLFERSRSGTEPTRAGELFLQRAARMLDDVSDLKGELEHVRQGLSGHVRIGVGPIPTELALPMLLQNLMAGTRTLRVSAEVGPSATLLRKVTSGELDLALCTTPQGQWTEGIDVRLRRPMPLGLLARAGHPLVGRSDLGDDDLAPYPLLGGSPLHTSGSLHEEFGLYRPDLSLDHPRILAEVVLGSDALMISTPILTRLQPPFSLLKPIDWHLASASAIAADIIIASRRGRQLLPAAEAISEKLTDILNDVAGPDSARM